MHVNPKGSYGQKDRSVSKTMIKAKDILHVYTHTHWVQIQYTLKGACAADWLPATDLIAGYIQSNLSATAETAFCILHIAHVHRMFL